MAGTFVKVPRDLLENESLKKPIMWNVYTHLLLMANYNGSMFKGVEVPSGSLITSLDSLSKKTGYTREQIRNTLDNMQLTQLITRKTTHHFTLISINNWELFQGGTNKRNTLDNTQLTQESHTKEHQSKNNKEYKEYKNINIYSPASSDLCKDILNYLNDVTGRKYKNSKQTNKYIQARLNDGYTLEDFKTVIDKKAKQWLNTEMNQYLRPCTLFSNKFDGYLNEEIFEEKQEKKGIDYFYE